jgi:3-phenylpropionate/trans-cinnamate dioxygenase ferredoxin reductase subunit
VASNVLIIGAGQAGFQVAASLREKGFAGSVTLVGDEPHLPYQRPPLSKGYLALSPLPDVLIRHEKFYQDNQIELRTGTRVSVIDRTQRAVALASGETLQYDHLVLATGGRNRQLSLDGTDMDGVLSLRHLDDADRLRQRLQAAGRIVIIGGGYIGLEVGSLALSLGIETCIVEAAPRLVARVASTELSEFFHRHYEKAGARILCGTTPARIQGSAGRADSVQLANGEVIPTQLVLICVGILPNVELAEVAGLEVANGIVVDRFLRTSDPSIYAVGDCARYPSRHAGGELVRVESVPNATDQGRAVAEAILGRPKPFESLPWFWSEQGKLRLQIAGLIQGHDRAIVKGDSASGTFSVFCFRGPTLVGVESMNRPVDFVAARRALTEALPITAEEVASAAFDLKSRVGPLRPAAAA